MGTSFIFLSAVLYFANRKTSRASLNRDSLLTANLPSFTALIPANNKREIGSANMLLGQLPTLAGAKELSTAYKVVFPAGVTGQLMTLKNGANAGLATTSIIGESGKIAGQAGLQSLSNLASPLAVFSALSMITGQYFMAEINKSIKALSENIEEVQKQIDTSEESVVFSASIFLQEIKNDWNLILESEDFKVSIISNIIKTINDLTSSCYYFENRLNTKLSELKTNLQKNKISEDILLSEVNRNKEFLKQAYELRSCLKLMQNYCAGRRKPFLPVVKNGSILRKQSVLRLSV